MVAMKVSSHRQCFDISSRRKYRLIALYNLGMGKTFLTMNQDLVTIMYKIDTFDDMKERIFALENNGPDIYIVHGKMNVKCLMYDPQPDTG